MANEFWNEEIVVQTYSKSFLGLAAHLSEEEAKSIAQRPGVVSVFPDGVSKLQTTRSWDFLTHQENFVFGQTDDDRDFTTETSTDHSQADTIIGIMDSGIWPEHPSFSDKNMGRIPARWKGKCVSGINSTYSFKCNRKLIGARYYDAPKGAPYPIVSARDIDRHGTHISSVAAGMPVKGASYYGMASGTARGGSPSSRIAAYCVCINGDCADSSILKAFDDAIADGVDVLSISLVGDFGSLLTEDVVAIGAFHAMERGITVVSVAGNGGKIDNVAPWITTVGATTIDRDFEVDIVLGNNMVIKGEGINFSGLKKSAVYHLVDVRSAKSNQTDHLAHDGSNRKGTIVVCDDVKKCLKYIGAIGMIVIDDVLRQFPVYYWEYYAVNISAAAITVEDGARILSYINSTRRDPLATILTTKMIPKNYKPAPIVPNFSARGPTKGIENLLKPDIGAPGVGILGAWPFNDTSVAKPGKEPPIFAIMSGTSVSCPHVSGLAALVKSRHPTWTPAAIRSAIMTTANQKNNLQAPITTNNGRRVTPYDIGAGEISLFGPLQPGLVYDTEISEYIQFLCNMRYNASTIKYMASTLPKHFSCPSKSSHDLISDMNYPSIAISGLKAKGRMVKRTVTNVGEELSTYTVSVDAPAGMRVQVVPKILQFTKNVTKQIFQVTFKPTTGSKGPLFGSITWSSINYTVRSPFAVICDA